MCDIGAHPDLCVYQTGLNTVYLTECDLLKLRAAFSFTLLLQHMAYRAGLAQKAICSHRLKGRAHIPS